MKRNESQNVEYKRSWHDEYLRWICGFAYTKENLHQRNYTKESRGGHWEVQPME